MSGALLLIFFPALLVYAAVSDMLTMTISNRVTLALFAGFFPVAILCGLPPQAFALHLLAGFLVLLLAFGMFAAGWMGGGDAKLAAATALWFGFTDLGAFALTASLFGGVLTLFIVMFRSWPLPFAGSMPAWTLKLHDEKTGIPYGIALATAALAVYPHTQWIKTVDMTRFIFG